MTNTTTIAADPEVTDDVAPESAAATSAVTTGGGSQGIVALLVTPVVLAVLSGVLYLYVSGAEKDSAERSALDWGSKLYPQMRTHIGLTLWSTVIVLALAVPMGILLTRPMFRKGAPQVGRRELPRPIGGAFQYLSPSMLAVANIGQALPAYGLFIIFLAWRGQGFATAVTALVVFALLPVLRNTMVGLEQVDPAVIEAGRGMGLSKLRVLLQIELPLAVPVILAGVRTALVINVGMASLAFLIGGGGLGITINSGLKLSRNLITVTGAGMVAILALSVDWVAAVVERVLRPKGL